MLRRNKWRVHGGNTQLNLLSFNSINFWDITVYYVTVIVNIGYVYIENKGYYAINLSDCVSKAYKPVFPVAQLCLNGTLLFHVSHVNTTRTWHCCTQLCLLMCVSSFLVSFSKSAYSWWFYFQKKRERGHKSGFAWLSRPPYIWNVKTTFHKGNIYLHMLIKYWCWNTQNTVIHDPLISL